MVTRRWWVRAVLGGGAALAVSRPHELLGAGSADSPRIDVYRSPG